MRGRRRARRGRCRPRCRRRRGPIGHVQRRRRRRRDAARAIAAQPGHAARDVGDRAPWAVTVGAQLAELTQRAARAAGALGQRAREQRGRWGLGARDPRAASRHPAPSSSVMTSMLATPSTSAWCVLDTSPKRGPPAVSGASPSTSVSSHSGRSRSSRRPSSSPGQPLAARPSPPGAGRTSRRDVPAQVEARVVDPFRAALAERHVGQLPPAGAGRGAAGRRSPAASSSQRRRLAREDEDRGHVHVGATDLEVQEGVVERAQAIGGGHLPIVVAEVRQRTKRNIRPHNVQQLV